MGEHLLCKQGVSGSIPLSSTKLGFIMDFRKYLLKRYFLKSVIMKRSEASVQVTSYENVKSDVL